MDSDRGEERVGAAIFVGVMVVTLVNLGTSTDVLGKVTEKKKQRSFYETLHIHILNCRKILL